MTEVIRTPETSVCFHKTLYPRRLSLSAITLFTRPRYPQKNYKYNTREVSHRDLETNDVSWVVLQIKDSLLRATPCISFLPWKDTPTAFIKGIKIPMAIFSSSYLFETTSRYSPLQFCISFVALNVLRHIMPVAQNVLKYQWKLQSLILAYPTVKTLFQFYRFRNDISRS
jgi:hypothetical protein